MNLHEAFKALNALNEDTFSFTDDGINKLSEFEHNDDLEDDIKVIDTEAETEDDLQDSYVGKVILDCSVCHSKLYKAKEEVELDDEEKLANVGEECPYCYTSDGFKVIGEVSEFSGDDSSDEDDIDDKEETIDADDEKIEEAFVSDDTHYYKKELKRGNLQKGTAQYERTKKDIKDLKKSVKKLNKETKKKGFDKDYGKYGQPEFLRDNPGFNRANDKIKDLDAKVRAGLDGKDTRNWGKNESLEESKLIDESVNNVNVETDDSIVNVATDENGKVTVTTEPNETSMSGEGEILSPISDETEAEITANGEEEVPVEGEEATTNEEEVEADVEEFDEETFDELGESYLRNIYENVNGYKTTAVSTKGNKLFIDGNISFSSGKVGKTSFIFEAKDITKSGTARFIGENKNITRGSKSFTIKGKLNEGKFISESLNYNYRTKNAEGKSTRVYGTVKVGKRG